MFRADQPVSDGHFSQETLIRAIRRLCSVEVDQSHFGEVNQIVGNSIIVGIKIFSIVVD